MKLKLLSPLLLSCLLCSCVDTPASTSVPPPESVAIYFADLSVSTVSAQKDIDAALERSLLASPKLCRFRVFPLHRDTRRAAALLDRPRRPAASSIDDDAQVDQALGEVKKAMEAARADTKTDQRQHTCIVDSLELASGFAKLRLAHGHLAFVYLSDMIEDCGVLPVGKAKSMEELATMTLENRFGKNYSEVVDLSGAKVVVCPPRVDGRDGKPDETPFGKMSVADQRGFWKAVFAKAKAGGEVVYTPSAETCAETSWQE